MRAAFCAALTLFGAAAAAEETGPVTLSPEEMRGAIALSLESGNAEQALRLSEALLQRDPEDVEALVFKSRAQRDLGLYREAIRTARTAHGLADSDAEIFATSMARAQALSSIGARTRAQWWLRNAEHHAPSEGARDMAVRDFRYVRSRNKWATNLTFSVSPTSNVNGGSVHDRISFGGLQGVVLSGTARALSGLQFSSGLTTRYRFSESDTHQTEIGLNLYGETYALSDEAQQIAPDAKGSDFAYYSAALGLRHQWQAEDWSAPVELNFLAGRGWYGGEDYSRFYRLGFAKPMLVGKSTFLRFDIGAERFRRVTDEAKSNTLMGGVLMLHELDSGAGLRFSMAIRDARSDLDTLDYHKILGGVGYTFWRQIAGADVTLNLDFEKLRYASYPWETDGRNDFTRRLGLRLFFERYDYYGFAPTVTISHSETLSTSDRYDTRETGVNFGFLSAF